MKVFNMQISEYIEETAHLSLIERGVLLQLTITYLRTEQPLCSDKKKIMRLHRIITDTEKAAFENVLTDFFRLNQDGYHHVTYETVIERSRKKSMEKSRAAAVRWNKEAKAKATGTAAEVVEAKAVEVVETEVDVVEVKTQTPAKPKATSKAAEVEAVEVKAVEATKKPAKKRLDWSVIDDITEEQIETIKEIRSKKRSVLNQNLLNRLSNQFKTAQGFGMSLADCVERWLDKGWTVFKAEWCDEYKALKQSREHDRYYQQPRSSSGRVNPLLVSASQPWHKMPDPL